MNHTAGKRDVTIQHKIKNENRKWWQFWKPRLVDQSFTLYDADINLEMSYDRDGRFVAEMEVSVSKDTHDMLPAIGAQPFYHHSLTNQKSDKKHS